jgi:hypothetical protein
VKDAKERANKELSHLTLGRKSGLDPTKPWDVGGLFQEVYDVALRFASQASATKLSAKVPEWLRMHRSDAIAVVSNMMTTNTTATVITVRHTLNTWGAVVGATQTTSDGVAVINLGKIRAKNLRASPPHSH